MTKKQTDPVTYLKNTVSKRGKSSPDGVYYLHPTVTVSPDEDYEYSNWGVNKDPVSNAWCSFHNKCNFIDADNWNEVLVQLRKGEGEFLVPVILDDGSNLLEFIVEDRDILLTVVVPVLQCEDFEYLVVFYQSLLKHVAKFAGKNPISIRFSIGMATMAWEDLVNSGEAVEMDMHY